MYTTNILFYLKKLEPIFTAILLSYIFCKHISFDGAQLIKQSNHHTISMSMRTTTIALSPGEKELLDQVAEEVFDESESIPYGSTVSLLVSEFQDTR